MLRATDHVAHRSREKASALSLHWLCYLAYTLMLSSAANPRSRRRPHSLLLTGGFAAIGLFTIGAALGGCGDDAEGDSEATSSNNGGASGVGGQGTGVGGQGGDGGAGGSIVLNDGWIGGPCADNADCPYDGGFCLTDQEGFPNGMCTLDCSQFCPDQDGAVPTFCIDPADVAATANEGLCGMGCDYELSPHGCRTGYTCDLLSRYNEPATVRGTCVPGETMVYPPMTACQQELTDRGIAWAPAANPMDHPDGLPNVTCNIDDPIIISPIMAGVRFRPANWTASPTPIFTRCLHGLAMADTAEILSAAGVTDLIHYGVYNCRVIAGTSTLSEHAYANAIDIAGYITSDGEQYTVLDDWEMNQSSPVTPGGQLLYSTIRTAFDTNVYNIILTPDYNEAHADHFHCDLTPGGNLFR